MGDTASSEKTANELVYTITIWYEFYHTSNKDEATIGKFHPDDLQLVYLVLKSTLQGWIIKYGLVNLSKLQLRKLRKTVHNKYY